MVCMLVRVTGKKVGIFVFSVGTRNTTIRISIVKQGESDGLELTEAILQCVSESFVRGCTQLYFNFFT